MTQKTPMPMCPMAEMCKGMMNRPMSSFALIVPGVLLILLGIVVIIEPRILSWLVAAALIVMGGAMLAMAKLMGRVGKRFQDMST